MGCRNSRPKETSAAQPTAAASFSVVQKEGVPDAVSGFLRVVNESNDPMARKMLEEWSIFVSALSAYFETGDDSDLLAFSRRGSESWLLSPSGDTVPYLHPQADAVGKGFLAFLRHDLTSRGWGGSFDYGVSGREDQGYLKVSVVVECLAPSRNAMHVANFDRKVNYVVTVLSHS
jgi:hypothetical protein